VEIGAIAQDSRSSGRRRPALLCSSPFRTFCCCLDQACFER